MSEEDTGVSTEVQADETAVESPAIEQTTEEVKDDVATSDEAEAVETETAETDGDEEAPEETLAPKSQNRFQKLANEKRELADRNRLLEERLAELQEFAVPTEQDYIDGGYDPIEAKLNALQAEMSQTKEMSKVKSLNAAVENDMVRIVHEFPQLDPKNPEFKQDLAVTLFNQYDKDAATQYADGIVLKTNQLPYDYIKEKMELIGLASKGAKVAAQKSVEKMVSAAETPTGKVTPKATGEMSTKELEKSLGIVYQ
jgi:hypothetical protein